MSIYWMTLISNVPASINYINQLINCKINHINYVEVAFSCQGVSSISSHFKDQKPSPYWFDLGLLCPIVKTRFQPLLFSNRIDETTDYKLIVDPSPHKLFFFFSSSIFPFNLSTFPGKSYRMYFFSLVYFLSVVIEHRRYIFL